MAKSCQADLNLLYKDVDTQAAEQRLLDNKPIKPARSFGTSAEILVTLRNSIQNEIAQSSLLPYSDYDIAQLVRGSLGMSVNEQVFKSHVKGYQKQAVESYIRSNKKAANTRVGNRVLATIAAAYNMPGYNKNENFVQIIKDVLFDKVKSGDPDTSERLRKFLGNITTPISALVEDTEDSKAGYQGYITAYTAVGRLASLFREMTFTDVDVDHLLSLHHKDYRIINPNLNGKISKDEIIKHNISIVVDRALNNPLNSLDNLRPLFGIDNKIKQDKITEDQQLAEYLQAVGGQGLDFTYYLFGTINTFKNDPEGTAKKNIEYNNFMSNLAQIKKNGNINRLYKHYSIPKILVNNMNKEIDNWVKKNPKLI